MLEVDEICWRKLMQMIRVNATRLQPANPDILEGVNDLIKLSYLNEPSVLHNLDFRYAQDKIYVSASVIPLFLYECDSLFSSSYFRIGF